MATVTLHHDENHNPFRKLGQALINASNNIAADLRLMAGAKKRQANVILKKLSGRDVTNYLLHASYEGFKQNLQGSDINIDYLLLTAHTNIAAVQHLAGASFTLMNAAGRKIISSLNRLKH